MRMLVDIDLSEADLQRFTAYEAAALARLPHHGARLEACVRRLDGLVEHHLLWFPTEAAFAAFRADPARPDREALAATGARVTIHPVQPIDHLRGVIP